jgi:hypothetical protein
MLLENKTAIVYGGGGAIGGGAAEVVLVDALDEGAVREHAVINLTAGSIVN